MLRIRLPNPNSITHRNKKCCGRLKRRDKNQTLRIKPSDDYLEKWPTDAATAARKPAGWRSAISIILLTVWCSTCRWWHSVHAARDCNIKVVKLMLIWDMYIFLIRCANAVLFYTDQFYRNRVRYWKSVSKL